MLEINKMSDKPTKKQYYGAMLSEQTLDEPRPGPQRKVEIISERRHKTYCTCSECRAKAMSVVDRRAPVYSHMGGGAWTQSTQTEELIKDGIVKFKDTLIANKVAAKCGEFAKSINAIRLCGKLVRDQVREEICKADPDATLNSSQEHGIMYDVVGMLKLINVGIK